MTLPSITRTPFALILGAGLTLGCGEAPQQRIVPPLPCDELAEELLAGSSEDGKVCKLTLPRGGLNVELLGAELPSGMGLTTWAAFLPVTADTALVMGDLTLTSDELPQVLRGLAASDIQVTAVHRHMVGESPPIHYVHYLGQGDAMTLVRQLRAALSRPGTAPGIPAEEAEGPEGVVAGTLCSRLEELLRVEPGSAALGPGYCKMSLPRTDLDVSVAGIEVPSAMGVGSWFAFRETRGSEDAVVTGDLALTEEEVNPALEVLLTRGVDVVALHNHMLFEEPRIIFFHFQARGEPDDLARTFRAALDRMSAE